MCQTIGETSAALLIVGLGLAPPLETAQSMERGTSINQCIEAQGVCTPPLTESGNRKKGNGRGPKSFMGVCERASMKGQARVGGRGKRTKNAREIS